MAYNPEMAAKIIKEMTKEELIKAGKQLVKQQSEFLKLLSIKVVK